jgi:hypothetical protein
MSEIHPQARATPRTRAKFHNVSVATVHKWKRRGTPEDRSHRPHTLSTTLTAAQEAIMVELRRLVLLPLDDLLFITREFINPKVSRSGLDRCLRRHGVTNLCELQAELAGEDTAPPKTFKEYESGIVHVNIKYLLQMPDEAARRYLFVAIARATRWVFQFTDRLTSRTKTPAVYMPSTSSARRLESSTDCARHAPPRPTAWPTASTAESARSSPRLGSPVPKNSRPP